MKKQRTSLFRVLILSLVMLVTLFIIGVAWFASKTEATATGLSIRSSYGPGLDSSFDGSNYGTYIHRDFNSNIANFQLPLITGNGSPDSFFIPRLDRATGIPVTDKGQLSVDNKNWASKRPVTAAKYPAKNADGSYAPFVPGDYYEEDIYFRSNEQLDVYLTGLSKVTPLDSNNDPMQRKSDFGEFSKDNIAGAARVGFFEVGKDEKGKETEKSLFTWIPNDKYQLTLSEDMAPIERQYGSTGGTGGAIFNPVEGQEEKWWNDLLDAENPNSLSNKYLYYYDYTGKSSESYSLKKMQMRYIDGKYVGVMDIDMKTIDYMIGIFGADNSSVGDFSHNDQHWTPVSTQQTIIQKDGQDIFTYELFQSITFPIKPIDENIHRTWAKLLLRAESAAPSDYSHWQVKISFEGDGGYLNVEDVIYYKDKDNYITTPGIGSKLNKGESGDYPYYSLEENSTILISNKIDDVAGPAYALNVISTDTSTAPIEMTTITTGTGASAKTVFSPKNPMANMLFSVISAGEDTSGFNQYKLKSVYNNKYLGIDDDGNIVLEDVTKDYAKKFKFLANKSTTGPYVWCNGYYLTFSNGSFSVSTSTEKAELQVYIGTSYAFDDEGEPEEDYKYYDSITAKALVSLPNPLTNTQLKANPKFVIKLEKPDESPQSSYMAHIRIRIWVEGTDREAKMPLAGGIFKTHLEFQGVLTGTEAPTNPTSPTEADTKPTT